MLHQDHNKSNRHHGNRWSRPLALFLALAMTVSLGADLTSTMQVYATNSTNVETQSIEGNTSTEGGEGNTGSPSTGTDSNTDNSGSDSTNNSGSSDDKDQNDQKNSDEQQTGDQSDKKDEPAQKDESDKKDESNTQNGSGEGNQNSDGTNTDTNTDENNQNSDQNSDENTDPQDEVNPDDTANSKQNNGGFEDDEDVAPQNDEIPDNANNAASMNGIVTKITATDTSYDPNGNVFSSNLTTRFSFKTSDVRNTGLHYTYTYADGVIIPDKLLNQEYTLLDSSKKQAGTYKFVQNSNGTYSVEVTLLEDYVKKDAGDTIDGYIKYNGQIDAKKAGEDGKIEIKGDDNVSIIVEPDQIEWPDGETNYYSIDTRKVGSYVAEDDVIKYTVTVTSMKGTPEDIQFEDTITASNMTLNYQNTEVKKQIYRRNYSDDKTSYQDEKQGDEETVDVVTPSTSTDGNKYNISMTLPKAEHYEEGTNSETGKTYQDYTVYTVTYTYKVSDYPGMGKEMLADNKAHVESKKDKITVEDSSEYTVKVYNDYSVSKSGWFDATNNTILWTIKVNSNKVNIKDQTLTDAKFAEAVDNSLTVSPNSGWEYVKDDNQKITAIKFIAEEGKTNKNEYTIQYRTSVTPTWETQTATNTASFAGKESEGKVTYSSGNVSKASGEGSTTTLGKTTLLTINWTVTIDLPDGGLAKDTVIADDCTQEGPAQYMTHNQVVAWANGIEWQNASGNKVENTDAKTSLTSAANITFKNSSGNEEDYSNIQNKENDNDTYTVWKITLSQDLTSPQGASKLVFKYATTADVTEAETGTTTFYNHVKVNSKEASAAYYYKKSGLIKTDENDKTEDTNKTGVATLKWKLKAETAEDADTLTITDTLPAGLDLVEITGENSLYNLKFEIGENNQITVTDPYNYYDVAAKLEDGKTSDNLPKNTKVLTLTLKRKKGDNESAAPKLSKGSYTFKITCKPNETSLRTAYPSLNYQSGTQYTFKNEASLKIDDTQLESVHQTQNWTVPATTTKDKNFTKEGTWVNNDRQIKYTLDINKQGKSLPEKATEKLSSLTLTDVLTYRPYIYGAPSGTFDNRLYDLNATLIKDSVKLYKAQVDENGTAILDADGNLQKGEEYTNWTWTVTENVPGVAEYRVTDNYGGDKTVHELSSTIIGKNLPNGTPLILEYTYQYETDMPNGYWSPNTKNNKVISNAASIGSVGWNASDDKSEQAWEVVDTSGEVTTDKSYTLHKVATGNYGTTLQGAQFKLQRYYAADNGSGTGWVDAGTTYTSDRNGNVEIHWQQQESDVKYETNVLYRLVETDPPAGYTILPSQQDKGVMYFYFGDTESANTLPDLTQITMESDPVDINNESSTIYAENSPNSTEISVQKNWTKYDGTNINEDTDGSITFTLYRKEVLGSSDSGSGGDSGGDSSSTPATARLSGVIKAGADGSNSIIKTFDEAWYTPGTILHMEITYAYGQYTDSMVIRVNGKELAPTSEYTRDIAEQYATRTERVRVYDYTLQSGVNEISGYGSDYTPANYTVSTDFIQTKGSREASVSFAENMETKPNSVTIQLKKGSENVGEKVVLNEDNGWKHNYTDLTDVSSYSIAVVSIDPAEGYRWQVFDFTVGVASSNDTSTITPATQKELVGTYTVSSGTDWKKTISGLPAYVYKSGVKYDYYYWVEETKYDGYITSYSDNNSTGIKTGEITITNKEIPVYEMPETGGTGTLPYTAGGTAAVIFSLLSGAYMIRRRKYTLGN